jgi:hypothetical protein
MINFYESIPIGKENAILRSQLCVLWKMDAREVRRKVAKLRSHDNGDDFVIISTANKAGYYRSDDRSDIENFKQEVSRRARHTFIPLKKVNRILGIHQNQSSIMNTLKMARIEANLKGSDVIKELKKLDRRFDKSLLSKIENGLCLPTPDQVRVLTKLYKKPINDLIGIYINHD